MKVKSRIAAAGILALLGIFGWGCAKSAQKPREVTILIKMLSNQQKFFRTEVLDKFEKLNNCKINIAEFDKMWDLETALKLQAEKKNPNIVLVKVPFEASRVLVGNGLMEPLSAVVDSGTLESDLAEYHPLALGLGYVDNVPYYIPRKLETRVMFYLKPKVAEAVKGWKKYEADLNKLLKPQNGYGLPKGYTLEEDPDEWDYYDLFVSGYYWAHEKYFNTNIFMPRIAHRGDRYEGTALGLVDQSIQLGAESNDILRMDAAPVAEMFNWEASFIKNGIYNPGMWEDPWRGSNLYEAIKDGKVFLTFLQQIDCFLVHGWEDNPEMQGYLKDTEDFGLATLPTAVSFALTKDGKYQKTGSKRTTTGGWWWGIPKTSPDKALSYQLARFITNRDNQAVECSKFGMIPVRKDILNNLSEAFDMGWVGDVFQVSSRQLDENGLTTVPLVTEYTEVGKNYIEAWYELCVDKFAKAPNRKVDLNEIHKVLRDKYLPAQKLVLKEKFPAN